MRMGTGREREETIYDDSDCERVVVGAMAKGREGKRRRPLEGVREEGEGRRELQDLDRVE